VDEQGDLHAVVERSTSSSCAPTQPTSSIGDTDPNTLRSIAVTAGWLVALVGLSIARVTRTDVD
jgi:hypothetical protein